MLDQAVFQVSASRSAIAKCAAIRQATNRFS
jgi:hypothetical protein